MNNSTKILNLILGVSIFLLPACSENKQKQTIKTAAPLEVNVITVKTEPIPIWEQFTGKTRAYSHQDVRARVSGVLEARYFKDGQFVKKGQKLFKIEQAQYKAALNAAKAKKAQDEASLELATADVNRYAPLVKEGLAPRATLEQYQAQQSGLKAAIAGDVAKIEQAQIELSYTLITAPVSGQVSARKVDVGNLVGQGEATLLTTIVKTDPLYAYFSPSQDSVRNFMKYRKKDKPDAFITLSGAREDIRLNGFVDFSNNIVDPLTSTITMRATIANPEYKILPGTFVYVNIFINDSYKFLMIPPEVIFTDQLGKFVYTVDKNSTAKRADIKTGYSSKYLISVKSGLKDGDKVIVSALMKIKDGTKITPNDVTAEQGAKAIIEQNHLIPSVGK